jgi:UPF0755 protein
LSKERDIERLPEAVKGKKRRSAFSRVLASLVGWGLIFCIVTAVVMVWCWAVFTGEGPLTKAKTVVLPNGASRSQISSSLEQERIISDSRILNGAAILWSLRGKSLKSGEYEFQPGASMANVLDNISSGRVVPHKLTIPEGWTSQMALARINSNEILTGEPVSTTEVPEGTIVADTAVFGRGTNRAKLVKDMMAAQEKIVDEMWAKITPDSPIKSKEELVTLASIVEKETGIPEERARVAAVFLNRLKQGMRLQSDPTIIYGMVGGQGKLERPLLREDIDKVTPYNTYQIDGLPPGPIAIPGRAALEAVAAPMVTDDLYFVADGTGGHAFAKTLDEHNANVAKWRSQQAAGAALPGAAIASSGEAEVQAEVLSGVVQPELPTPAATTPAVSPATPSAGTEDAAIAEAAQTQQSAQPVPAPAGEEPSAQVAAQSQPVTLPRPVEKKPKEAISVATSSVSGAGQTAMEFIPGTVVVIGGRKIPVPLIKQKKL